MKVYSANMHGHIRTQTVVEAAVRMCAVGHQIDPWDSENSWLYDELALAVEALIKSREDEDETPTGDVNLVQEDRL